MGSTVGPPGLLYLMQSATFPNIVSGGVRRASTEERADRGVRSEASDERGARAASSEEQREWGANRMTNIHNTKTKLVNGKAWF